MERLTAFLLVLGLFAFLMLILALPYLFPPQSAQECHKISDSYSRSNCFESVAILRGEKHICSFLDPEDKPSCEKMVKEALEKGTATQFEQNVYWYDSSYYYSYDDHVKQCAVDGIVYAELDYSKGRLEGSFYDYDVKFAADCLSVLQDTNESICANDSIYRSEIPVCKENMRLAKNQSLDEVCADGGWICKQKYAFFHNDSSICEFAPYYEMDGCYQTFAVKRDDPGLCENAYDDGCWKYFALKDSNIQYCERISSSITRHHCRAVLLAEQGS